MNENKPIISFHELDIAEAVFIVFLILKLLGKITWSWWWITAPLWIPLGIVVIGIIIMCFVLLIMWLMNI